MRTLIVGGTSGTGQALARSLISRGDAVIITGRDSARAKTIAEDLQRLSPVPSETLAEGLGLDLSRPQEIADRLAGVGPLDAVVLAGMTRDQNSLADYDVARAIDSATIKVVGYSAVLHALRHRLGGSRSVLLFGGIAKHAPYPGSTTVSAVNGAVVGMVATFMRELAPTRVNAIHPGLVVDSPVWKDNVAVHDAIRARTLSKRAATMEDIVAACLFLLDNPAVNGVNLTVDGGMV